MAKSNYENTESRTSWQDSLKEAMESLMIKHKILSIVGGDVDNIRKLNALIEEFGARYVVDREGWQAHYQQALERKIKGLIQKLGGRYGRRRRPRARLEAPDIYAEGEVRASPMRINLDTAFCIIHPIMSEVKGNFRRMGRVLIKG